MPLVQLQPDLFHTSLHNTLGWLGVPAGSLSASSFGVVWRLTGLAHVLANCHSSGACCKRKDEAASWCRYNDIYAIFTGTLGGLFGAAVVLASALIISLGAYVPVGLICTKLGACLRRPRSPHVSLPRVNEHICWPSQPAHVRE